MRNFEEVRDEHKYYATELEVHGKGIVVYPETKLPVRADKRSAGYDFYSPIGLTILPGETELIWTNVKAKMYDDELLYILPRSSYGIKYGIVLANTIGLIDSSYYENEGNGGNIGIALTNTSGKAFEIKPKDRIAQGVFMKYLTTESDEVLRDERKGGIGDSGR